MTAGNAPQSWDAFPIVSFGSFERDNAAIFPAHILKFYRITMLIEKTDNFTASLCNSIKSDIAICTFVLFSV